MRILVTGGSGFIGRNLAEQLASTYEVLAPSSAELDLLKDRDVRDYLDEHRCDVVVHAATTRSNRRVAAPPDLLDRNCRMFFNLARNADRFGKMIHFGSGAEYDRTGLPPLVKEEYFDTRVPADAYGFSKYICAKYIERSERIVDLRLFGVFGPHEDYTVRFISNACCRALKGLPIVLRQDVLFDYLYVGDLVPITRWFIENDARHKAYNVCTGRADCTHGIGSNRGGDFRTKSPHFCLTGRNGRRVYRQQLAIGSRVGAASIPGCTQLCCRTVRLVRSEVRSGGFRYLKI